MSEQERIAYIDEQEMIAKLADPAKLVVVFLMMREGVSAAVTEVEDTLFTPGTPTNEDLDLYLKQWPAPDPLLWGIFVVPRVRQAEVEQILARHKMRLADGVPTVIQTGQVRAFPIQGDHVRHLEYNDEWYKARDEEWQRGLQG